MARWLTPTLISIAWMTALLAGCAQVSDLDDDLAMSDDELAGGDAFTDHSLFAARSVVEIRGLAPGGEMRCSGTLVSPRLVLTASHCFRDLSSGVRVMTGGDPTCSVEGPGGAFLGGGGCGRVNVEGASGSATITHVFVAETDTRYSTIDVALAVLDRRITPSTPIAAPSMEMWLDGDQPDLYWGVGVYAYMGWGHSESAVRCSGEPVHTGGGGGGMLQVRWPTMIDTSAPIRWQGPPPTSDPNRRVFYASDAIGPHGLPQSGDSGGPLVLTRGDRATVVGVLQGAGCESSLRQTASWNRLPNPIISAFIRRIALRPDGSLRGADTTLDDSDGDRVAISAIADGPFVSEHDNCPAMFNPDQLDTDRNGRGDACEPRLSAPIGFTARALSTTAIELSWNDTIRRADTYTFDFRLPGATNWYSGGVPVSGSGTMTGRITRSIERLEENTRYEVRVCASGTGSPVPMCAPPISLYTLFPPRRPRTCPIPGQEPCGPRGRCIRVDLCE